MSHIRFGFTPKYHWAANKTECFFGVNFLSRFLKLRHKSVTTLASVDCRCIQGEFCVWSRQNRPLSIFWLWSWKLNMVLETYPTLKTFLLREWKHTKWRNNLITLPSLVRNCFVMLPLLIDVRHINIYMKPKASFLWWLFCW